MLEKQLWSCAECGCVRQWGYGAPEDTEQRPFLRCECGPCRAGAPACGDGTTRHAFAGLRCVSSDDDNPTSQARGHATRGSTRQRTASGSDSRATHRATARMPKKFQPSDEWLRQRCTCGHSRAAHSLSGACFAASCACRLFEYDWPIPPARNDPDDVPF
jgi:hypothetical protein